MHREFVVLIPNYVVTEPVFLPTTITGVVKFSKLPISRDKNAISPDLKADIAISHYIANPTLI